MTAPSAEVLKNMIDNLEKTVTDKLDGHAKVHDDIINLIKDVHSDVKYTNGKVGELIKWRERLIGMSVIISIVVIPIMGWALWEIIHIDDKIDDTLADYEFEVAP